MAERRSASIFHQQQKKPSQQEASTAIAAKLHQSLAFHREGKLTQAERLYREILAEVPFHFDALHLLGLIEATQKNYTQAVELLSLAVKIDSNDAAAHCHYGVALHGVKRHADALASYDRALALKPDYAEALNNRGVSLQRLHRHREALESYDRALALTPDYAEALNNRGNAQRELKRYEQALASYDHALSLRPDYAEALNNRGNTLRDLKRHEEALASYDRALALKRDHAEALNNRGVTLQELKRHDEALASYDRALLAEPNYAAAFYNRGKVLQHLKRHLEALASYDRAISLRPDYAKAFINRGSALQDLRRYEEALASYDRALSLQPDSAEALNNRGNMLLEMGEFDETAACYRQSLSVNPDCPAVHDALIFAVNRVALHSADIFAQARIFAAQFERNINRLPHRNTPDPDRKLKVGYVSGDFREHSVACYIEPILANHDGQAVEVYCYSNHSQIDHVTERLMAYPDHWRSIVGLSDDQAAALVQEDGIDILVDLSGHTSHNRLLAFARKPAPVQVTWIGLPCTTGLSAMDYRLTNHYVDPVGMTERYHSETLVRLSTTTCFQPVAAFPPVHELPALSNGYVTFASFKEVTKISPAAYALWSRILGRLPDSRLMIVCDAHSGEYARQTLMAHGVGAERVIFADKLPLADYLALHNQVDIVLDTFPYNGSTITRNSLWMGVPVVSLAGLTPVSRVGLALMSQVGLKAFVAHNEEEYVQIALRWARDLEGLAQVRRTLRQRLQESPSSNARARTRELEVAYRQMWRTWCAA